MDALPKDKQLAMTKMMVDASVAQLIRTGECLQPIGAHTEGIYLTSVCLPPIGAQGEGI
jgi:hypothetical protein